MKRPIVFLSLLTLVLFSASSPAAPPRQDLILKAVQVIPGHPPDDLPVASRFTKAAPETVWYGGHDGTGYALEGGLWDFDTEDNGGPGFQGWYGVDQTENTGVVWGARVTASSFTCPDDAPMIHGTAGQLWFGKHLDEANAGCWVCDAGGGCDDPATTRGYENNLCQRAEVCFDYNGGDVNIVFDYFLDLEGFPYDYVKVQLIPEPEGEGSLISVKNVDDGTGGIIGDPKSPATFDETVPAGDIPGGTTGLCLRFEFVADGGWSDEDGEEDVCSTNGPLGADDIVVADAGGVKLSADFDTGDEGFTFSHCPGVGDFVDIHDVSLYEILDPCQCKLEGNVLSFHDENFEHPQDGGDNQYNAAVSPIIDRRAHPAAGGFNDAFVWADLYAWMPLSNGVLYRPGAQYYPWECELYPGTPRWSPRSGQQIYLYLGMDPVCFPSFNNFVTDGVPADADYYRVWYELLSCCACFGIAECTGITNETPLFDNIRFGLTRKPDAPVISFGGGGTGPFHDVYAEDGALNPASTGRVDCPGVDAGVEPPYVMADSMAVSGPPVGGSTPSWEAFLHFSVVRKGPMQDAVPAYSAWKARLPGDPETEFVSVKMDSTELNSNAFSNKFCSFAHEDDPFFNNGFADHTDENEILPDDVFTPGTRIEFYMTADFDVDGMDEEGTGTDFSRLPVDGEYEFEILPSMRWSGEEGNSAIVWPCLLYWDAYNRGAEQWIEPALAAEGVLPDVPGPGPDHDRYDQLYSCACFTANALFRSMGGGNSGGTLVQLLSYNTMILNTGDVGPIGLFETDMIGVGDWLTTTICDSPNRRRGFIANGNEVATIIESHRPSMLTSVFGAGLECSPYREPECPPGAPSDSSYCVELIWADGAAYPPATPYYAFGNGCPNVFTYSVLSADGGVGNRDWRDYDGDKGNVSFAEVVHDASGGPANFRAVLDGYSYHYTTTTFDEGLEECVGDSAGRVTAIVSEIAGALDWIFDGDFESFCVACDDLTDLPEAGFRDLRVDRLYQNEPNPFNPRTAITFSVARKGPVELRVFDVSGRLVRTLVDGPLEAGLHRVPWDGTDDRGRPAGSGVYWTQLAAGEYVSSKKIVLVK